MYKKWGKKLAQWSKKEEKIASSIFWVVVVRIDGRVGSLSG